MFTIAQPGWTGFDAAFPPAIDTILASPYDFMSCYVGGAHDQRQLGVQLAANGRPVSWNYERSETAWTGGYNAGRAQAIDALRQLHEIEWEEDSPCIFSPYDSTVTNYQTGYAFAHGVFDVFGDIQSGFYGDEKFLQLLSLQSWVPKGTVFWQWMNDGPTLGYATIRQTGHGTLAGYAIDNDLVKKPVPMWTGPGKDDPVSQQVDTLAYITADGISVKAIMTDGTARPITGPEFYGARGRVITDAATVTQTQYDNWPPYVPPGSGGVPTPAPTRFTITGEAHAVD